MAKTVFFRDKKPPVHDKKPQMTKNTEIWKNGQKRSFFHDKKPQMTENGLFLRFTKPPTP